jgi:prevent-host-death family protein
MDRVGVRQLRQNLSVYLRRVKAGESLEVTERGEPVARLTPAATKSRWERLVAEGKVRPASRKLSELPPPKRLAGQRSLSQILQEMRDAERT